MPQVKFVKLHPDAKMPTKATEGSACWDLYAAENKDIEEGAIPIISIGIAVEVPKGYFLEMRPRSGLSSESIIIPNSPCTIDNDYRGEVKVMLRKVGYGFHRIIIGDRIAQCRLVPIIPIEWVEVDKLSETERGEGGFGSTGR